VACGQRASQRRRNPEQRRCVSDPWQNGPVRTSVVQFPAQTDSPANLLTIRTFVHRAADAGSRLVVLPEGAMHDFGPPEYPLGPAAESLSGAFVTALSGFASQHRLTIVAGMFESSGDPTRPYNTLVVVDASGELVASYRKAHLYDSFGYSESDRLLRGDAEPVTVKLDGITLGLLTCYDLRFPEFARAVIDAGADTLVVPAAWVRGPLKEDHWVTLLRARAIENTAYVIAAAQNGKQYCGCSMVVDPMGVAVAGLGEQEGIATAEVEPERITEVRRRNPSLSNRRLHPAS